MSTINLLYKNTYEINEHIKIIIPTVGQIINNEDDYYGIISLLTAMPIDLICELDDMGVDFSTINEWDLFLMIFGGLKTQDTSLVFEGLDLSRFEPMVNQQNGNLVLRDDEKDITIDRAIYSYIADVLRKIHHLEKNRRKPGNEEAKKYMIERAKIKRNRKKRKENSQLESLIVAMVNTEQFKYNFEQTLDLSIYQFNESVRQIINKVDYEHKMFGIYSGSISAKDLKPEEFNWLSHK